MNTLLTAMYIISHLYTTILSLPFPLKIYTAMSYCDPKNRKRSLKKRHPSIS